MHGRIYPRGYMQIFVSENRPKHLIGEEGQPNDIKKQLYTANLFFMYTDTSVCICMCRTHVKVVSHLVAYHLVHFKVGLLHWPGAHHLQLALWHESQEPVCFLNLRNVSVHLIHLAFIIGFWDQIPILTLTGLPYFCH